MKPVRIHICENKIAGPVDLLNETTEATDLLIETSEVTDLPN